MFKANLPTLRLGGLKSSIYALVLLWLGMGCGSFQSISSCSSSPGDGEKALDNGSSSERDVLSKALPSIIKVASASGITIWLDGDTGELVVEGEVWGNDSRDAVVQALLDVPGVVVVLNRITVNSSTIGEGEPPITDEFLGKQVATLLRKDPIVEKSFSLLRVSVSSGRVVLHGSVGNGQIAARAILVTLGVPGVSSVSNRLIVNDRVGASMGRGNSAGL